MSSKELLAHLAAEWSSPDCAFIPEFRGGTGWSRESRADAIAMHCWPSRGLELVGFELKISRGDWLRERKQPWKADPIKQFCDRWYLVVSDASIVRDMDEIPADWGFMFPVQPGHPENQTDHVALITYKPAPKLNAVLPDKAFIAALMRRATKMTGGEVAYQPEHKRKEERVDEN